MVVMRWEEAVQKRQGEVRGNRNEEKEEEDGGGARQRERGGGGREGGREGVDVAELRVEDEAHERLEEAEDLRVCRSGCQPRAADRVRRADEPSTIASSVSGQERRQKRGGGQVTRGERRDKKRRGEKQEGTKGEGRG
eukprot:758908-Hanusia_phi.AAC.2